jgi:type I restriction enzyme S subunit
VLGALDDKIEQNGRMARTLERLAQAVFRAWFVDFEPIKAKAAGAISFPSMQQAVFDALPALTDHLETAPAPEGWEVKMLTNLFDVNPPRSLRKGELAPYLDMKNMPTDGHAPDELSVRPAGSGAKFVNGDTLVARITPCLENGKTAFVDFLGDGEVAWGSTEYIVLRPRPPIPPIFAYLLARTNEFRSFAIQSMTGTSGRQRVPFSALEHFSIPTPPSDILLAFGELVGPLIARSSTATRESRSLARLRDLLLPRLLSGELRVGRGVAR